MAVAAGTNTTASISNGATTTTFSFVSTSSPLYVRVACWMATATLNTVTFGGVSLTRVTQSALSGPSSANDRAEIWRLLAPTASTANIVLTFSTTGQSGSVGACNVTGQDGTTPEGTSTTGVSSAAGTTTGAQAISGAATGDLTISVMANGGAVAVSPSWTGGSGGVEEFDLASNGEESEATKVSDACTAITETFTSNTWAFAAIVLKTTAGAAVATEVTTPNTRRSGWESGWRM